MSNETLGWLNDNVLVGFTEQRNGAWWSRGGVDSKGRPNHFETAVPLVEVEKRLFNWTPEPASLQYVLLGNKVRHITEKIGVTRSDTGDLLGIFAENYPFTSYRERLLDGLSDILDTNTNDLGIGSAGLLRGGAQAWVQIEEPDTTEGPGGIKFRTSLLAATSLDGSLSNTFKRVLTMVVCDNTLSAALGETGPSYRYKNTANNKLNVMSAREALQIVQQTTDAVSRELATLIDTKLSDDGWSAFLAEHVELDRAKAKAAAGTPKGGNALTRATKKMSELNGLYREDERVAPWTGTVFGALQAVNTWDHWVQGGVREGTQRVERNAERMVTGYYEALDDTTLTAIKRFATV